MRKVAIGAAQAELPRLIETVDRGPIALTRRGKVCAAIVAMDEADFEAYALARNCKLIGLIERSRERSRQEGNVPLEALERKLKLPARPLTKRRRTNDRKRP